MYGIPEFRLPKEAVVRPEIENVRALGVKIETNIIVGKSVTIDELMNDEGFEAVFVGSGADYPNLWVYTVRMPMVCSLLTSI